MSQIKTDVEYVLGEVSKADSNLNEMKENISNLKKSYESVLEDQKSPEFINEFRESIGELIEQVEKLSDESIGQLITGLENIANTMEQLDEEMSSQFSK